MAKDKGTTRRGGGESMDFTPVDYDVSEMPVDAPEGAYTAKIKAVKVRGTKEDNYPMLEIDFRLTESHSEDGEDAVKAGASLTSFIAFFPASEGRRGAPSKIAMRALIEALHLDEDLIPTRIESKRDLDDLIDALKGQELTVYVVHREDKNSGEVRCDVRFKAPKALSGSGKRKDDDEDEDERPKAKANGARNGASNGARNGAAKAKAKDDEEDEDEPRRAAAKDDDDEEDEPPPRRGRDRDEDRPRARR